MIDSLYFYSHDFARYNFGAHHPFSPQRQIATDALIRHLGLLNPGETCSSIAPVPRSILEFVHTPHYIDTVKLASQTGISPNPSAGLSTSDTPAFAGMHRAAAIRVAATVDAVQAVGKGKCRHAVNLGDGLHHAMRDKAAGFCVYNDAAVGIEYARRKFGWRVAYVDIDAHHGDGVQWCFYDDPNVLTVSIHQCGRTLYPGTGGANELGSGPGYGTSVNIPLEPGTRDHSWWASFERIVPAALRRFQPDLIVSQHGVDAHFLDPLSHLEVTTGPLNAAARSLHNLAHELCDGRWVALGGGGYSIWQVVPRAWTALWAIVSGREIPTEIPARWRKEWSSQADSTLPETIEEPAARAEDPKITAKNLATVAEVERLVMPQLERISAEHQLHRNDA